MDSVIYIALIVLGVFIATKLVAGFMKFCVTMAVVIGIIVFLLNAGVIPW